VQSGILAEVPRGSFYVTCYVVSCRLTVIVVLWTVDCIADLSCKVDISYRGKSHIIMTVFCYGCGGGGTI